MNLPQLVDKVTQLEQVVDNIRAELAALRQQMKPVPQAVSAQPEVIYQWADKTLLRQVMAKLFETLSITGEPIAAEALQQMMGQANLRPNELSRGLIEAREE